MFSKLRSHIGTAGLVVAIVALVAALGGGAIAATGGSGGDEATASAKGKQGKPGKTGKTGPAGPAGSAGPAGPVGPAGPAGSVGPAGGKGDQGIQGIQGVQGPAGKSVEVGTEPTGTANCGGQGGATVQVAGEVATKKVVCNGQTGFTETLPFKKTETGSYVFGSETGTGTFVASALTSISFAIPLSGEIDSTNFVYVTGAEPEVPASCENTEHAGVASVSNPEADPGFLCAYKGTSFELVDTEMLSIKPTNGTFGASTTGAILAQEVTGAEARGTGTWAVTGF